MICDTNKLDGIVEICNDGESETESKTDENKWYIVAPSQCCGDVMSQSPALGSSKHIVWYFMLSIFYDCTGKSSSCDIGPANFLCSVIILLTVWQWLILDLLGWK